MLHFTAFFRRGISIYDETPATIPLECHHNLAIHDGKYTLCTITLKLPPHMNPDNLTTLRDAIRDFAQARDWEQFHTPKNLVMALSVETAELMEHFQWLTPEKSMQLDAQSKTEVGQEIADVLIYLMRLADVLGIDPLQAAFDKIQINAAKYPVEKSRGHNTKYNKLDPSVK